MQQITTMLKKKKIYVANYYFLKLEFHKLEFDMKFELMKIELLRTRVYETRVPCDKTICLCLNNEKKNQISQQLWPPIPREPDKRKKKEKPKPGRIRNKTESQ